MEANAARRRASKVGVVTSNRMDKSVVVRVDRIVLHKVYKRFVRRSAKFMAHDEEELCRMGDLVMIVPCQRLSKRKHFMVREIIRAKGVL